MSFEIFLKIVKADHKKFLKKLKKTVY